MASRHLAGPRRRRPDYEHVYREVLARAGAPVVLHWLGAGVRPAARRATSAPTDVDRHRHRRRMIARERRPRARHQDEPARRGPRDRGAGPAAAGTTLFTGDDYNYVGLIEGDGERHSDALLGAFALVAPSASAAIQALDAGDPAAYRRILGPTEALARHVFAAPTFHYKTGVAFLSWLNGHQRRSAWSAACTRRAACRTCPRWCGWPTRRARSTTRSSPRRRWNA